MQRWQRRAHLVLWLLIAAVLATVFVKLNDAQPQLTSVEIPRHD